MPAQEAYMPDQEADMPDAIPRSARARGRIAPAKMAHIVLRTNRYDEMIAWWSAVLELEPLHANPFISFLTFDEEHHRLSSPNHGGEVFPLRAIGGRLK